jgi:hypothetical protein
MRLTETLNERQGGSLSKLQQFPTMGPPPQDMIPYEFGTTNALRVLLFENAPHFDFFETNPQVAVAPSNQKQEVLRL